MNLQAEIAAVTSSAIAYDVLTRYLEEEIALAHKVLEKPKHDEAATAVLRGRILMCRRMLSALKGQPTQPERD